MKTSHFKLDFALVFIVITQSFLNHCFAQQHAPRDSVVSIFYDAKLQVLRNEDKKNATYSRVIKYRDGKIYGPVTDYYKSGKPLSVGYYADNNTAKGHENGQFTWYYENGTKFQECTYVIGMLDGAYKEFYPSGAIKLCVSYSMGNRNGCEYSWDENGKASVYHEEYENCPCAVVAKENSGQSNNNNTNPGGNNRPGSVTGIDREKESLKVNGHYYHGDFDSHYKPRIGLSAGFLPYGYYPFYWDNYPYYFSEGFYYQYDNNQYKVVEPPIGAEVTQLPEKAQSIAINDRQYYELNGVYYQPVTKNNGTVIYQIEGKDTHPKSQSTLQETRPGPGLEDIVTQLPDDCRKIKVNGENLYVSPDGAYYQEQVDDKGNKTYKIVGTPSESNQNYDGWITQIADNRISVKFPATPKEVIRGSFVAKDKDNVAYIFSIVDFVKVGGIDSVALAPIKATVEFAGQLKTGIKKKLPDVDLKDFTIGTWNGFTSYVSSGLDSKRTRYDILMFIIGNKLYSFTTINANSIDTKGRDVFFNAIVLTN